MPRLTITLPPIFFPYAGGPSSIEAVPMLPPKSKPEELGSSDREPERLIIRRGVVRGLVDMIQTSY